MQSYNESSYEEIKAYLMLLNDEDFNEDPYADYIRHIPAKAEPDDDEEMVEMQYRQWLEDQYTEAMMEACDADDGNDEQYRELIDILADDDAKELWIEAEEDTAPYTEIGEDIDDYSID